ncbi:hypothetical protein GOP47_0018054 [Adiantum capillus-veneris]|uniref:Nodulin-like domain-containing protein n=1 Tax=Adiantum capillus-veneris TaxID=13818 RepID=A0A9D4ZCE7_ADICA|nr:hypothetical protein GOP47_0018054 [Adiantum capillus-veneris]
MVDGTPSATGEEEEAPAQQHTPATTLARKWLGFVSALWVQAISGNNYTFANYSVELKAILGVNQVQLNGLSSAKDVGKAFGVFAGLLSDHLPPWTILLIGSLEGMVGYGVQWLVISQKIQPLPYWMMCVVMCMGGNSTTWMNTAVLVTCVRNFQRNRGPVSGILKAYVGLSTAIFTDLCTSLFTGNASAFVLMLALIPLGVCVVAMFLLKPVESEFNVGKEHEESRCFTILNCVAIVLALYLLAYDLSGIESELFSKLIAGGLGLILVAPVALPIYLHVKVARGKRQTTLKEPLLTNRKQEETKEAAIIKDAEKVAPAGGGQDGFNVYNGKKKIGDDFTVVEALRTADFWLLFFCFLCGVGTGMAVINNMGQIGQSMGYSSVSIFVSLISIWGFFGRLGSGALSEALIRWKAVPRPVLLAVSQLVMVLGYVSLAVGATGSLYVGSIVVGICYGVRLAVSVPVASEMFGLRIFGLMYNLLILNLPLGSFLFSSLLAGFLYDYEAAKEGSSTTCLGSHCYRLVFLVMAGISGLGFVLDSVLTLRTRPLYQRIQRSKRCKS